MMLVLLAYSSALGDVVISMENDVFAHTDRNYTHGTRIMWTSETNYLWGKFLENELAYFRGKTNTIGVTIAQYLYTPKDKSKKEYMPYDRPYAGWLYAGFQFYSSTDNWLDFFELDLGTVGPNALAKQTQNEIHKLIHNKIAQGWDNQIRNEPGANLLYQKKYRERLELGNDFQIDIIPHGGGALGNIHTFADAGCLFRAGYNLPDDYGFIRMEPGARAFNFSNYGIYFFADTEGKWVIRDIFLDGNTFRYYPPTVEKKPLTGEISVGFDLKIYKVDLIYAYNIRTKEFYGQEKNQEFGTISLGFSF